MARADRRRATRQARTHRELQTTGHARVAAEQDMFFPRLRKQARWMFVFLALVFGLGFVLFGVGSGSGGLSDLLQGNFGNLFGTDDPSKKDAEDAREKIAENPKDAAAYLKLATALQTQGNLDESIAALQQYRKLRPKDTEALAQLAALYLQRAETRRDRGNAIQVAGGAALSSTLFTVDPNSALGKALTGTAGQGGFDPVNKSVQLDVQGRSDVQYKAMQAAYDDALAVYQDIADATPRDPNAWSQLAQAAEAAGNVPKAITAYEKFLQLAPDDPLAEGVKQRLAQLRQAQPSVQAGG
jgi:tetratricopeptide (TPR) repeat protein